MNETQLEQYLERLADRNRQSAAEELAALAQPAPYLVILIDNQELAIDMLSIKCVLAPPIVTAVPYLPREYRGVFNLRGQLVSLLDLRARLRREPVADGPETSVVVLDFGSYCTGVVVDSISRVLYVQGADELQPVKLLELEHIAGGVNL